MESFGLVGRVGAARTQRGADHGGAALPGARHAKLLNFPAGPNHPAIFTLSWVPGQASLNFVGGILLALGLFTRPVAFVLSGDMAVGYFMAHAPRGFFPMLNGGDGAILYCFIFLYFAAAGPGPGASMR